MDGIPPIILQLFWGELDRRKNGFRDQPHIYVKLPFLDKTSKWPVMKDDEERVVNPSYDAQIQDGLIDELLQSLEHKDVSGFRQSLSALIQSIKDEGQDDA